MPFTKANELIPQPIPILEGIPERANLKLCCDQSTIPQGSWDASMSYVPRWDSALGVEGYLDYMYPIISTLNTNTPRRVMCPYVGPALQFGLIGGYVGKLASTWIPTGAFTTAIVFNNPNMDSAGELLFTSATGWIAPHNNLGMRWVISSTAHKTTGWPAGQTSISLTKGHVLVMQWNPSGAVSKCWLNGVALADTDLQGMPAIDRLIFGGNGSWQFAGIYCWDGLTVDAADIYAWAKARYPNATLTP